MAKIGRNAPCPCGSGKKYKKCCLPRQEEEAARPRPSLQPAPEPLWIWEDDPLEDLSNRVLDLIEAGRFDEADEVCRRLRKDYPDVVDGLSRQAEVYEARGMYAEAASYYRRSAAFARNHEGFDEEGIRDWEETADRLDPGTSAADP